MCLGNICRSPMAEGALRARIQSSSLAGRVTVDSAGTSDWHAGRAPDARAVACAAQHGVDIAPLRARSLTRSDFTRFDWVLCADRHNLRDVLAMAPAGARERVAMWLPWSQVAVAGDGAIPDPYSGDASAFEQVWQLVDAAALATVRRLERGA